MRYVIIGNSTAGIAAIEGIRSADPAGDITVISSENHHCYGRPTISYYLKGDIKAEQMLYRPRDFYQKNGVRLLLCRRAEKIDAERHEIELSGGERLEYDKLLVATGSRPIELKTEGMDKVKAFHFMSYDDALALEAALTKETRVLVIGAGLIGLKCVEGILDRVKSVSVVDLADRVLPSVLDREGAAIVRKKPEERGVRFYLGDCAQRLDEHTAVLKSGKEIPFDLLIVAVGVVPNTEIVRSAGGRCNRGILIDTHGRTSLEDVYAAGDCAEGFDSSIGKERVLALLPNAYFQGLCAGKNMAGEECVFENAIPMNAVGFFGLHVLSAGAYEGECLEERSERGYKKLFVKEGRLAGFILIGDIARAGIYTSLIRDKTDLSTLDFDLIAKKPQLAAFPQEARRGKLAKKV